MSVVRCGQRCRPSRSCSGGTPLEARREFDGLRGAGEAWLTSGRLGHRRAFAADGRAVHVAHLFRIERTRTVHGGPVVPHHQVPLLPFVRIDELTLRGVLDQVAQQGAGFRHRPADDGAGVGSQIQRFPPGGRMPAHQALQHRLEADAVFVGEIGKTQQRARVKLAVFAHQIFDFGLRRLIERLIGGTHIREFRVAAG